MSNKEKEFREEQKEAILLREELTALIYFLPGIKGLRYMHYFMLAFIERYDKTAYKYFMDIKEGKTDRTMKDFIADQIEFTERLKTIAEKKAN